MHRMRACSKTVREMISWTRSGSCTTRVSALLKTTVCSAVIPRCKTRSATCWPNSGMRMGVFVIDGGENWKISLATGKQEHLDVFLKTCERSVELARRVNAKWATVVPGFFERKLPIGVYRRAT